MAVKSPLINVMIKAVMLAARKLKRDFGEVENLQVSRKGPADFVSAADLRTEQTLHDELARARPEYGFLMEESGRRPAQRASDSQRRWVVDPLDGTSNFLHGLPHFAISVAVQEHDSFIAGVVYDPIKDELFHAEKGQGAYLNDRRLRVSSRDKLAEALVASGMPFLGHGDRAVFLAELDRVMAVTSGVRRWGTASLDLAYVAAGRFDGFWERDLSTWDVAAGVVLVREAGGYVSEIGGRAHAPDSASILAANDRLHGPMVELLDGRAAP